MVLTKRSKACGTRLHLIEVKKEIVDEIAYCLWPHKLKAVTFVKFSTVLLICFDSFSSTNSEKEWKRVEEWERVGKSGKDWKRLRKVEKEWQRVGQRKRE